MNRSDSKGTAMNASKHETLVCPRCGGEFVCKCNRVSQCECMTIQLTREIQRSLAEDYEGCLCLKCLTDLREERDLARTALLGS